MNLRNILTGRQEFVIKAFDSVDSTITRIPGYCWSFEGAKLVYGGEEILWWPYRGKGLYIASIRTNKLQPWPFQWAWTDGKGHVGPPQQVYEPHEIKRFMHAQELVDLAQINAQLGYSTQDPKVIARDLVKSIKPGVVVDLDSTYTNNFEAIINIPITMYLIATGEWDNQTTFHLPSTAQIAKLVRKPSI